MKFGFDWPSGFRGQDHRNCGQSDDERRRTDAGALQSYNLTF